MSEILFLYSIKKRSMLRVAEATEYEIVEAQDKGPKKNF